MNSKTNVAFGIVAIAAVIALFASGPLVATHQAQAFGFGRGGFHHFGFFHRGFGFGFPGFGFGGGCGCC
ncbi:MAG TPA: hypothetical protein VEH06_02430 [Candidatus Bathyarchaeia archaeon]|nr:hypothetical protein [Candidatus Bathyarchaeia archaeon]